VLAIVGTIPDADFPLATGEVTLKGGHIYVEGRPAPVNRGTPALMAAAIKCLDVLGLPMPYGFLAGDIGLGDGSRRLYEHLVEHLPQSDFQVITFHYLQPDVDWHNKVLFAIGKIRKRPKLIADAGFMYAAKMSGLAEEYDLFTPDAGELAFLADEEAPHPFYTRGFILHEDQNIPELIRRAYAHRNAARRLLVKGRIDYVAGPQGMIAAIDTPSEEALEPIGGTGDTLTGILSALICGGFDIDRAALLAARANRIAGRLASPTPMTQVAEIIARIPEALGQALENS
jgi:NAD(P)H-hydrate repair Nnr-like enzyme with NAD(P)H-hydrate dehydratase domain